jgi:putative lipoic acid-binding regulatory protein
MERIRIQESSNGRFRSVTLYITATGKDQLVNIHKDLMAHANVRMVI